MRASHAPIVALAVLILVLTVATSARAETVSAPHVSVTQTAGGLTSLESAAAKASSTARAVAMSLIGLAFAIAGTVLAFRRDFKDAAGVFVVGMVAVLFASPAGVGLVRDTVTSLFG